jgi:hypothetical protein
MQYPPVLPVSPGLRNLAFRRFRTTSHDYNNDRFSKEQPLDASIFEVP